MRTGTGSSETALDRATEGVVRVDDADGEVYLFGSNDPEGLADAIERATQHAVSSG